jgi:hypothetical protein
VATTASNLPSQRSPWFQPAIGRRKAPIRCFHAIRQALSSLRVMGSKEIWGKL